MTNVLRWAVVAVLVGHGFIHLLGVAKGFGWAEIPQLKQPMGVSGGILWLLAAVYVIASAVLMAVGAPPWWWLIAACGAVVSQAAIVTSWTGTIVGSSSIATARTAQPSLRRHAAPSLR